MPLQCDSCRKLFDWSEQSNGYTYEDDDTVKWDCEECYENAKKEVSVIEIKPIKCEWCKEALKMTYIISDDKVILHTNCYQKILSALCDPLC